ncbi:MAG: hypothetical protein ACTS6A_01535 [Candidatus Hodgkinia cicadicola]
MGDGPLIRRRKSNNHGAGRGLLPCKALASNLATQTCERSAIGSKNNGPHVWRTMSIDVALAEGASPINVNENETCGQQVSENEDGVEFVRRGTNRNRIRKNVNERRMSFEVLAKREVDFVRKGEFSGGRCRTWG